MIKFLALLIFPCFALGDKPEWYPYVTPMMLGRTFDKSKNQVGIDLITLDDLRQTETVNGSTQILKFKAGKSDTSKRDLLDVGGSLAVQIKGGFIKVKGSGQYIKDDGKGENFYELLTLVQRKTQVISLASEVKHDPNRVGSIIGKHYVSQIQYGANMVASLKFKYKNETEKENIKAAIEGSISDTSGAKSFEINAAANLSKIDESLNGQYSLEIKYYADVPLDDVPQNIEDFKALVNRFFTLVEEKTYKGMGRPIMAYVQPLSALIPSVGEFSANSDTNDRLPYLEREIDDLHTAKNLLYTAMKNKRRITDAQETRLGNFYDTILSTLREYRKVISKLNLETGDEQFQASNTAYSKIEQLDSWNQQETLCPPDSSKRGEVGFVTSNKYTSLANVLICNLENEPSDSTYDVKLREILGLKTEFMDKLNKRNLFLNNVLLLNNDYTHRAQQIFQHYFMATRDGEQSGLTKGGTVVFDNLQLASAQAHGYDQATGIFTAPKTGLYLLSQHVSGTGLDIDGDSKGACPITQAHTKTQLKEMNEGDTYKVPADTVDLKGQSSFMGILVDVQAESSAECTKRYELEHDEHDESGEDDDDDESGKDDDNDESGKDDDNDESGEDVDDKSGDVDEDDESEQS